MRSTARVFVALGLAMALPPATLMLAQQAGIGRAGATARPQGPCDIYAAAGTPCVTAHSSTRALLASYNGPLYQVTRQSDGKTLDIGVVPPSASPVADAGGYVDAAAQDAFCNNTVCFISRIYDQSGKGNHLYQAPPGTFFGPAKGGFNTLPIADMAPITIGGHKAYGVFIMPGMGLRNNNATGLAIDDEPEGIYSVVDGTHYDSGCCFDYGNASTNSLAVGRATMETTYFGISTTWGSGSGPGPWIMADMEAGLFSGYNARQNPATPTIDSWRFVTAMVNGGGGNKWDLRGGNAQSGTLSTYYSGVRPASNENSNYFPMHKPGAVLLGNGGDNGNGSSGTFYEGVITRGYPTEAAIESVQANIVSAKYDVQTVKLSRVTTFAPGAAQDVVATFTNTTGGTLTGVKLSVAAQSGWTSVVSGSAETSKTFTDPIAAGASVSVTFKLTAPAATGAGFLTAKAEWTNSATRTAQSETATSRVRNVLPIKINEILLGGATSSNQFIELFNAGTAEIDISNWTLINTQSQWAPVKLATIPAGTRLARGTHYLLGLSASGLAAPAVAGEKSISVRSTAGLEANAKIDIDGETRTIATVGTAASPMTTVFIPVSTGPWMPIPAGATNLPVTSAAGFVVGEKIGIDLGGNYEQATVTAVGKAATQTSLSAAATAGATSIRIAAGSNIAVGDALTISTGARKEFVTVKSISTAAEADAGAAGAPGGGGRGGRGGAGPATTIELVAPLTMSHASGVDVAGPGTGITFTPPTKFAHTSGDAVQALGSGITLDSALSKDHTFGAPVVGAQPSTEGYQGPPAPNQWFGGALSPRAGSIALMDAGGVAVVDAVVYGSQQSNSSANGTIASPELATLEGDQGKGGCIVAVPQPGGRGGRGRRAAPAGAAAPARSAARTTDGTDADSLCNDFQMQSPTPGAANQPAQ